MIQHATFYNNLNNDIELKFNGKKIKIARNSLADADIEIMTPIYASYKNYFAEFNISCKQYDKYIFVENGDNANKISFDYRRIKFNPVPKKTSKQPMTTTDTSTDTIYWPIILAIIIFIVGNLILVVVLIAALYYRHRIPSDLREPIISRAPKITAPVVSTPPVFVENEEVYEEDEDIPQIYI